MLQRVVLHVQAAVPIQQFRARILCVRYVGRCELLCLVWGCRSRWRSHSIRAVLTYWPQQEGLGMLLCMVWCIAWGWRCMQCLWAGISRVKMAE